MGGGAQTDGQTSCRAEPRRAGRQADEQNLDGRTDKLPGRAQMD
jgi:hypothetical protein